MNRTESVFTQDGLSSTVDTSDKLKLGEFFYLRRNNRYSLICVHCFQEFDQERFAEFTAHIEQHLLRIWGIQVKPMKMENPAGGSGGSLALPSHTAAYAANDSLSVFKNEFGPSNAADLPQYFYNGYNPPNNWFQQSDQQVNPSSSSSSSMHMNRKDSQFDEEFNALKRQFNEPMFVINDTPEVRQLSQYLSESYPVEKRNGQYKCPLCDKLFNGSALARRHVYTHSVDKVFACASCQRKFSHARHLRDHIRCKHGNPANLPERPTNRSSSNRSYDMPNVSSHIGNHFMNVSAGHAMVLSGEAGSTAFQQEFDALRALYKDNKAIIVNDLPEIREISQYLMPNYEFSKINDQVMCPLCDGLFNSKSTVRRHLTNHLKVKMFRCGQCEREFRHARHLNEHIKSKHHSNFYQGNSANTDYKTGGGGAGGRSKPVKSEPYETNGKVECSVCHTKFKRRSNIKTASGSGTYSELNCCNGCNKEIARRQHLNARIPIVDDKNLPQRHMASKPANDPKYKCDVCNETFNKTDKLLNHRRTHKEPMKFYCKFCNLGFMDQKTYAAHELQHTKPYDDRRSLKPDIPNALHMPMVGMPIQ